MKTQRYACPKCGNAVTLHVTPSVAPVCVNPKVHSSTPTSMELVASDDGQRRRV